MTGGRLLTLSLKAILQLKILWYIGKQVGLPLAQDMAE
jgi:hypothetical protein